MSDPENEKKVDSEETASVMTPETLKESLDELAKNVDSLVDGLTMGMTDSPVDENRSKRPAVPPTAPATQTPPSKTPPATPVPDEPTPAATFAPEEPAEAPETTPTAADEDLVAAGSIDEDLEIMGLAGDVIDSVAGTEADPAEADAPSAESVEPEATAEIPAAAPMTLEDRIDAELAKTVDPTVDSATEAEDDDFMAMSSPVEPPKFEDTVIGPEELWSPVEPEPSAPEDMAASPEELSSPAESESPALEAQDTHTVPEPPDPLDLDVQKEIDAIDAGLDRLLVQDGVGTGAETEEPETLKLANGHLAESAAPEIKLAAGPAPAGMPDEAPAAGQTSRLKKPARADVIPWSTAAKPGRRSRGMSRTWRLVAAVLFMGAVCGGAWVMLSTDEPPTIDFQLAASGGANRDTGDATSRNAGSAIPYIPASSSDGAPLGDPPGPDEIVAAQPETPPVPEAPAAAPVPEKRAPSPPRAETPKPVVAKKPPPAPAKKPSGQTATKPRPQPVKQETEPAKPEPKPAVKPAVKTAPSDPPKVADARPVPAPVTAPKPPPEQPVAAVTNRPEPATPDESPTGTQSTAPTTAVASNVDRDLPAPVERPEPAPPKPAPRAAAGPTGPSAPQAELVPPHLVTRQEPIYPPRARKRGEGGVVELKVLVNEQGRVVRVVVEQGLPGSELEARAIDAALRSTYRPATEAGQPVRAWVTERFVFEP